MSRNPNEYQWQEGDRIVLVAQMTRAELEQALCKSLDLIEAIQLSIDLQGDRINNYLSGREP